MKATVKIVESDINSPDKFYAEIKVKHPFLASGSNKLVTTLHSSKGQLQRKVIQFCGALNLNTEWI